MNLCFEQSFLTAAISSVVASGYGMAAGNSATKAVGQVLFVTFAGGITAELSGGNFWEGAATGFVVSLLNHYAHEMGRPDPPSKYKAYFSQKLQESQYLDKSLNLGSIAVAATVPFALTASAVDGPIPIGEIVGGIALAGAATYDLTQRVYVTYTLRNGAGQVYSGRASGFGSPYGIMMGRYASHHMRAFGYGSPTLDVASKGYPTGYWAIRGREQQLIDFFGGVGSPNVGNSINGISPYNPARSLYLNTSSAMFGPLK